MKEIIVIKPNTLSVEDKQKLTDAGCVVVETENIENIKVLSLLSDTAQLNRDDYFMSALKAVNSNFPKDAFAAELLKRLTDKK